MAVVQVYTHVVVHVVPFINVTLGASTKATKCVIHCTLVRTLHVHVVSHTKCSPLRTLHFFEVTFYLPYCICRKVCEFKHEVKAIFF